MPRLRRNWPCSVKEDARREAGHRYFKIRFLLPQMPPPLGRGGEIAEPLEILFLLLVARR
jgi:hypothetical protein